MAASLKRDRALGVAEQPLAFPEPVGPTLPAAGEPASILLVDDDEKTLRALAHLLEPLGQNIVSARSGEAALRWLLREEFAVILLDMRMPGLDGLQTARYINARARTRHIPIIFLTAHGSDVQRVFGAHAAGAVDYVSKPFEPDVLRSKVAVFVELHRARAEHVVEARARAEAEGIASTVSKLQSISDAALAHLELEELVPQIVRTAGRVFASDGAGLLLRGEEDYELTLVIGDDVERTRGEGELAPLQQVLARAIAGLTVNVPDLRGLEQLPGALGDGRLGSLIAAPLTGTRKPLGSLFLASSDSGGFADEELVLLNLGAERVAIALEHALSYEREKGLVEVLQDHLLPDRLPLVPGLEMAARYRPSERLAQVGGDWYDAIALPGGRLGLVIGDVVGHGVGAATLMAELRAALRAYALGEDTRSPADAVAALNSLVNATHGRMVATLLYMIVEAEGTSLRFASAGHPPPLVVDEDGDTHYIAPQVGPPLGATETGEYRDYPAELAPGSTLLLYTDGLIERRGEVIDAGLARLGRAVAGAPADLETLCAHVLTAAADGQGLGDDTALLALRRLPRAADVLDLTLPAEPRAVSAARHRLRGWLADVGCDAEQSIDITLAANEACTNAVEHAYGPSESANFRLIAECSPTAVVVRVSDQGHWRPPHRDEGGRGLRVIRELMDQMQVHHAAAGTTVEMIKGWGPGGGS
jgi:serine phosphatase RsbU (regulator of sigma subunit)/CheY-like chemotaxis protein/anti-sigma regulatory factor (Ser/Thr protein kinase)